MVDPVAYAALTFECQEALREISGGLHVAAIVRMSVTDRGEVSRVGQGGRDVTVGEDVGLYV